MVRPRRSRTRGFRDTAWVVDRQRRGSGPDHLRDDPVHPLQLREGHRRRGAVEAVRSLFTGPDGASWSGIEAPVPSIRAPGFDLDAMLGERLVRDGIAAGARPSVAYRNCDRLGFKLA